MWRNNFNNTNLTNEEVKQKILQFMISENLSINGEERLLQLISDISSVGWNLNDIKKFASMKVK
jgi:hypothetical protein